MSIGGTLTHFAAPPILMVARTWGWDTRVRAWATSAGDRCWRSSSSNAIYFVVFRRELAALAAPRRRCPTSNDRKTMASTPAGSLLPVPAWLTAVHLLFMAWTVINSHYPALFLGGFLIFLGFAKATAVYQSRIELKSPLLVGFFLAGLVIHGGLQGWWIAPVLASLAEEPLFFASTAPDGVQRQRAHHVPGHAGARS